MYVGHYIAYIHDEEWYKIDDNKVCSLIATYIYIFVIIISLHEVMYIISCCILYILCKGL